MSFSAGQVAEIVAVLVASNVVIAFVAAFLAYRTGYLSGRMDERAIWIARADRSAYRAERGIDR